MLITWDSRNGRRLQKAVGIGKDYGLTALSTRVYIGNVKRNDLPGLQHKLRQLFQGKKDRLLLFMLCKSCMEVSTVPLAIQKRIVQLPKFELVG
jgi:CRISPR/Cas system-associated endoribonuclease Cas2